MTKTQVVLMFVCAGCAGPDATSTSTQAIGDTPTCVDITTAPYNAKPASDPSYDPVANRDAINAAISAALTTSHAVCVPAGEFRVARPSGPGQIGSIVIDGVSDLTIVGAGPSSAIAMYEPSAGHCVTQGTAAAWYLFFVRNGASRITFRDLTLRAVGIDLFKEQTHILELGDSRGAAGIDDILIQNMRFEDSCGDAIFMNGSPTTVSSGIKIVGSVLRRSARRNITINDYVTGATIAESYFESYSNAIDVDKVTGTRDLAIDGNVFVPLPPGLASQIVVDARNPVLPVLRTSITNNLIFGAGLDAFSVDGLTMRGNLVVGPTSASAGREIIAEDMISGVLIEGNTVIRTSTGALPVIHVNEHDHQDLTYLPRSAVIRNNFVFQSAANYPIVVRDVFRSSVDHNVIVFGSANTDTFAGVRIESQVGHVDSAQVADNVILGGAGGGRLLQGVYFVAWVPPDGHFPYNPSDPIHYPLALDIDHVAVTGNVVTGAKNGVSFFRTLPAGFRNYPLIRGNVFEGLPGFEVDNLAAVACDASCVAASVTANYPSGPLPPLDAAYTIGGSAPGPRMFVGDNRPGFQRGAQCPCAAGQQCDPITNTCFLTIPDGSSYMRRDGGPSTTFWIHQNGAWAAK